MAFGATQIFPNDTIARRAIGCDIPFNGNAVFTPNYQTKDAIKNNLINYFLTNPGERPGNPEFGAGLRKFIFTQIETENLDFIQEDLQEKISREFPRVVLKNLEVIPDQDNNTINVKIGYAVESTNIEDEVNIEFA